MRLDGNFGLCYKHLIAERAMLAFGQTGGGTSGSNSGVNYFGVNTCPSGRHTVHISPIVPRVYGLGVGVIIDGDVCGYFTVRSKNEVLPLHFCTGIVHRCGAIATIERMLTNFCHTLTNDYARQATTFIERSIVNVCSPGNRDTRKTGAISERILANECHAIRDGDACKAGATVERLLANECHAIGNGDAGKAGAIIERMHANARHAIANGDTGKAGAKAERRIVNACHAIMNGDAGKAGATGERKPVNACYTFGNH